jgi:hypothetical protein
MATPAVYAGWRAIIKFNNNIFAAGFVMDYTIDTMQTEILGLDNVFPEELASERVMVTMSMRVFRTPDNDPVALGIAPGGDSVDGGATKAQVNFTSSKYIQVEIRDKVTDRTILMLPKAQVFKRTGQGEAEQLITENWFIRSIGYFGPGAQVSGVLPVFRNLTR